MIQNPNIMDRRKALGMTRKQLASKTGVPFASLYRYEHGISKIPHERFKVIDHLLSREEMKQESGNPKL